MARDFDWLFPRAPGVRPGGGRATPGGPFGLGPERTGPDPLVAQLGRLKPGNPWGFVASEDGVLRKPVYGFRGEGQLEPVTAGEKQAYLEWLVGAKASHAPGVQSPQERTARAMLGVAPPKPPRAARANGDARVSDRGLAYIKSYERGPDGGPALRPYASVEGGAPTIGWGHKVRPGEDFSAGITPEKADEIFRNDVEPHAELVRRAIKVPLTQHEFDALASLAYNYPAVFTSPKSELVRLLNSGDFEAAAEHIATYNTVNGKPSRGLTRRRKAEQEIFRKGVYAYNP